MVLRFIRGAKQADADYFGGTGWAVRGMLEAAVGFMPRSFFWSRVNGTAAAYDAETLKLLGFPARD